MTIRKSQPEELDDIFMNARWKMRIQDPMDNGTL
jgi:hypothetical protein